MIQPRLEADTRITEPRFDLSVMPAPPAWTIDALCAQTDPDSYFPEKGGSSRAPKEVCRQCPVATPCLQYALDHDERFGIWGGLTERERRQIKRRRRLEEGAA